MKIYNSNIKKSIYYLKKNECIGIPTETVYGLGANAYSFDAVEQIYALKKRPKNNPLIVHYYNRSLLKRDCYLGKYFLKLYKKFCPGPLTFILRLKNKSMISKNVTNGKRNLAVRFPNHPVARKLLNMIDFPLAAPSANISTSISPVSKFDVIQEFGSKIKYVLNGGRSNIGLESTIIDLTCKPKIVRLGALNIEDLKQVLQFNLNYKTNINHNYPGQNKLHYSPGIPIKLNVKRPKKNSAYMLISRKKEINKNFF